MDTWDPAPVRDFLVPGVLPEKVITLTRVRAVLKRWEECVGQDLAGYAIPERYKEKVLYVRVKSSVWLQELHMRKRSLLSALNALVGEELFEDVRFYVGGGEDF